MRIFDKNLVTLRIKFYYINLQVIYMLILLDLDVLSIQYISQFYFNEHLKLFQNNSHFQFYVCRKAMFEIVI